jgi:hypothetical protein
MEIILSITVWQNRFQFFPSFLKHVAAKVLDIFDRTFIM